MVKDSWEGETEKEIKSRNEYQAEQRRMKNKGRASSYWGGNFIGDVVDAILDCLFWM